MDKFYDSVSRWCLGANVNNPIRIANLIKFNNLELPYNVLEGNATNQINTNNNKNYNLIITNYDEERINVLKGIIENIIAQYDN